MAEGGRGKEERGGRGAPVEERKRALGIDSGSFHGERERERDRCFWRMTTSLTGGSWARTSVREK